MLELAFEQVGDRLEPPVGMVGGAARLAGGVVDGLHLVEQEERVEQLEARHGERTVDAEAGALVLVLGGDDGDEGTEFGHDRTSEVQG